MKIKVLDMSFGKFYILSAHIQFSEFIQYKNLITFYIDLECPLDQLDIEFISELAETEELYK